MKKLIELIKNDHIKLATVGGICIIAISLFFKKVLHTEVPNFEPSLPGFVIVAYEVLLKKEKLTQWPWSKVWLWSLLMFLVTGLVVVYHLWMKS